jgi:hypothetical protein
MKNIHVLPTDKPSRLHTYNGVLNLAAAEFVAPTIVKNNLINLNIYITSDEEIKEEEYGIDIRDSKVFKCERTLSNHYEFGVLQFQKSYCKKIILTTDQDLIEDGVQAIDDEFDFKADELKAVFDYPANSNPGVFNTTDVEDDCRIALDIYQTIRHERYLQRIESGEQTENHYTVDESPADICDIAKLKSPDFHIKCKELVKSRL